MPTTPNHPQRVSNRFTVLLGICAFLSLLTDLTTAAPASQPAIRNLPPHISCQSDLAYGDAPGKANVLDVYLPEKVAHPSKSAKPLPLIVWIHGGGWSAGDKSGCPAVYMVSQGFAVASINYRLTQQAPFPAQIQDCKGAIRFLRAHADQYNIDSRHIGVWGASAGGHLVALLGTSGGSLELEGNVGGNLDQSSQVQAVCDWFGPTDMSVFADQALRAGIIKTTPGPKLIMSLFGGSLQEKKELVQQANPISFISKSTANQLPPFLIMHGDKDALVPVAQSQMLTDALTTAGAKAELQILPGAGHGIGFNTPAVSKTVLDFFVKNLK